MNDITNDEKKSKPDVATQLREISRHAFGQHERLITSLVEMVLKQEERIKILENRLIRKVVKITS